MLWLYHRLRGKRSLRHTYLVIEQIAFDPPPPWSYFFFSDGRCDNRNENRVCILPGMRICIKIQSVFLYCQSRVAEVVRGHGGPPPKSLVLDENFKLQHTLFCRKLRFVAIYALFFGDLWPKKVPFWVKTVLLGQEVHYYMVYIAYFTELNSKI